MWLWKAKLITSLQADSGVLAFQLLTNDNVILTRSLRDMGLSPDPLPDPTKDHP